jgi:hypothetical protein
MKLSKILLLIICCSPYIAQAMHDPEFNKKLLESLKRIREQDEERARVIEEFENIYPEHQEHKREKKYI